MTSSPTELYIFEFDGNRHRAFGRFRMAAQDTVLPAHPTACRICVPVGDDCVTTFSRLYAQCDGICRPPEAGVICGADCLQQHFMRSGAEGQTQGAVAIVRIEPVVRSLERKSLQLHQSLHARRLKSGKRFSAGA